MTHYNKQLPRLKQIIGLLLTTFYAGSSNQNIYLGTREGILHFSCVGLLALNPFYLFGLFTTVLFRIHLCSVNALVGTYRFYGTGITLVLVAR